MVGAPNMENTHEEFDAFIQRRHAAAEAYTNGDPAPLRELTTGVSPATFFGPMGGIVEGAKEVWADYERGAQSFERGGETRLEIRHLDSSGDLAYWVGLQHARVRFRGGAEPVPMVLRITEVFRRESGEWRLIHRHADSLAERQKKA